MSRTLVDESDQKPSVQRLTTEILVIGLNPTAIVSVLVIRIQIITLTFMIHKSQLPSGRARRTKQYPFEIGPTDFCDYRGNEIKSLKYLQISSLPLSLHLPGGS